MVIEWLKVRVPSEVREKYIQKDAEIWTPLLASYSGFLNKEVWISPNNLDEVILVIYWNNREAWKSVPSDRLEETERKFTQAMGASYPIIESSEYQVRKYSQISI